MPNLSINELSELTGKTRATIKKALDQIPFLDGPKSAKLYHSKIALEKIYCGGSTSADGGEFITNQEATRLLTIARKDQIDLEMEVTRKDRWPKEDVEEIHESALSNVAGLLKAHEGKTLSTVLIQDIFTELRGVGAALAKL